MRDWLHRRDEHGVPQRFETHGQAARWAAMRTGVFSLCILVYGVFHLMIKGYGWPTLWPPWS